MKTTNAIKKIEKATGKTPTIEYANCYVLDYNAKYSLVFHDQYGSAILIHIKNNQDPDNPMTDYFSSIFFDNMKQALEFLANK